MARHVRHRSVHRDLVDGLYDPAAALRVRNTRGSGADRRGTHAGPRTSPPVKEKGPVDHSYSSFSGRSSQGSSCRLFTCDVERLLHGPRRQLGNKWDKGPPAPKIESQRSTAATDKKSHQETAAHIVSPVLLRRDLASSGHPIDRASGNIRARQQKPFTKAQKIRGARKANIR